MKKNGFTLAEVLITLAIIGVVATMTLPSLMSNTSEQQYIAGLKKAINVLTEAAQLSLAIDNVDYSNIATNDAQTESRAMDTSNPKLFALISSRMAVDHAATQRNRVGDSSTGASDNYAIFFRDGSALYYPKEDLTNTVGNEREIQEDGLVGGLRAVYDVNGAKGPNVLTNCSGKVAGAIDASTATCSENNLVVGDRFAIRLRGTIAVPNGPAARTAYSR